MARLRRRAPALLTFSAPAPRTSATYATYATSTTRSARMTRSAYAPRTALGALCALGRYAFSLVAFSLGAFSLSALAPLGSISIAHAGPAAPLPTLPAGSTPTAGGDAAAGAPAGDVSGYTAEQVRRGVVQVEQAGRPIAIGTVLLKDGRVLTALSPLAGAEVFDVRYADGTVVKARIGHKDKAWDLALLVPLTGKWAEGLVPTNADPQGIDLRAFLPKAGKLAPLPAAVKGRVDAKSKEGETLRAALDLDMKGASSVPGTALIDPDGRVVGIVVRACKESSATPPRAAAPSGGVQQTPPCTPQFIGAPIYAVRGFLMKTPAEAVQPAPWLGIGGAPTENGNVKGVRVMGVAPGSPAEKAGLKAGEAADTILAVDGQPVETPEQLADVIAKRSIGQQVKLLLFSGGKFRDAVVTLRAAP